MGAPYRDQSLSPPCPRCGAPLHGAGCARCGGVFLSRKELTALAPRLGNLPRPVPQEALRCPRCQKDMRRIQVPNGAHDIALDACDTHGTWFDREELERLGVTEVVDGHGPAPRGRL